MNEMPNSNNNNNLCQHFDTKKKVIEIEFDPNLF